MSFLMQEQMVRGKKVSCKKNFKRRDPSIGKGSDDSDEDYVVSDEENEVSDGWDEDYCSSLDRHASEESFGSFVEKEEEEEVRKVVRSKVRSKGQESTSGHRKIEVKTARKRKRDRYDEEEDEDEDYEVDDEEDEDEEFILDEDDCSDEEEESVGRKKRNNTKVRKRSLRKKGSVRGQKRRRKSNISKKPLRKKRRKNSGLRREVQYDDSDDDNGEFLNNRLVVRENNKKPGQRKRRYVARSDSDFVSSGSSDCDYRISEEEKHTISEEEREQVREANEICGSLRASLRSSCFPSGIQEVRDLQQQRNPPVRKGKEKLEEPLGKKGKEKVEEVRAEVVKQVCGICLTEEDKRRLRGTLDCCSHYFCFVCIMEWSKVESRCPLCKQRFKTISKPARSTAGIDLREALIQVPERDQVSYLLSSCWIVLFYFAFLIAYFWV